MAPSLATIFLFLGGAMKMLTECSADFSCGLQEWAILRRVCCDSRTVSGLTSGGCSPWWQLEKLCETHRVVCANSCWDSDSVYNSWWNQIVSARRATCLHGCGAQLQGAVGMVHAIACGYLESCNMTNITAQKRPTTTTTTMTTTTTSTTTTTINTTTTTTTTSEKNNALVYLISVRMTLNIDYQKLGADDKDELKGKMQDIFATSAGVHQDAVSVTITPGSVKVSAEIQAPDASSAESIKTSVTDNISLKVLEAVNSIPGVKAAVIGGWIIESLEVQITVSTRKWSINVTNSSAEQSTSWVSMSIWRNVTGNSSENSSAEKSTSLMATGIWSNATRNSSVTPENSSAEKSTLLESMNIWSNATGNSSLTPENSSAEKSTLLVSTSTWSNATGNSSLTPENSSLATSTLLASTSIWSNVTGNVSSNPENFSVEKHSVVTQSLILNETRNVSSAAGNFSKQENPSPLTNASRITVEYRSFTPENSTNITIWAADNSSMDIINQTMISQNFTADSSRQLLAPTSTTDTGVHNGVAFNAEVVCRLLWGSINASGLLASRRAIVPSSDAMVVTSTTSSSPSFVKDDASTRVENLNCFVFVPTLRNPWMPCSTRTTTTTGSVTTTYPVNISNETNGTSSVVFLESALLLVVEVRNGESIEMLQKNANFRRLLARCIAWSLDFVGEEDVVEVGLIELVRELVRRLQATPLTLEESMEPAAGRQLRWLSSGRILVHFTVRVSQDRVNEMISALQSAAQNEGDAAVALQTTTTHSHLSFRQKFWRFYQWVANHTSVPVRILEPPMVVDLSDVPFVTYVHFSLLLFVEILHGDLHEVANHAAFIRVAQLSMSSCLEDVDARDVQVTQHQVVQVTQHQVTQQQVVQAVAWDDGDGDAVAQDTRGQRMFFDSGKLIVYFRIYVDTETAGHRIVASLQTSSECLKDFQEVFNKTSAQEADVSVRISKPPVLIDLPAMATERMFVQTRYTSSTTTNAPTTTFIPSSIGRSGSSADRFGSPNPFSIALLLSIALLATAALANFAAEVGMPHGSDASIVLRASSAHVTANYRLRRTGVGSSISNALHKLGISRQQKRQGCYTVRQHQRPDRESANMDEDISVKYVTPAKVNFKAVHCSFAGFSSLDVTCIRKSISLASRRALLFLALGDLIACMLIHVEQLSRECNQVSIVYMSIGFVCISLAILAISAVPLQKHVIYLAFACDSAFLRRIVATLPSILCIVAAGVENNTLGVVLSVLSTLNTCVLLTCEHESVFGHGASLGLLFIGLTTSILAAVTIVSSPCQPLTHNLMVLLSSLEGSRWIVVQSLWPRVWSLQTPQLKVDDPEGLLQIQSGSAFPLESPAATLQEDHVKRALEAQREVKTPRPPLPPLLLPLPPPHPLSARRTPSFRSVTLIPPSPSFRGQGAGGPIAALTYMDEQATMPASVHPT